MEIIIKMKEEELKQMLKNIELDMVGAEGTSSTKSEEKKTIINQLTYINIIKNDLQIQILNFEFALIYLTCFVEFDIVKQGKIYVSLENF